ncbi:helix-turn-helix domain-containing protein [Edaphobacter sp. DSM 109919]|uniref:Helix-turn-helix domain-containing protein n=1 Tax=Edaphobacter paludis TaxID=3035702 RepID=A0AAU7CUY3_9BACT
MPEAELFNFSAPSVSSILDIAAIDECFIGEICASAENSLARMVEDYGCAITVVQLAKILQCSRGQIYKLIDDKRLPALKVGTMVRLDPGTVADWIRRKMTMTA